MTETQITAVILAAGLGTRMKSAKPKVMHAIGHRPMIQHLCQTLEHIGVTRMVGVIGEGMTSVKAVLSPHPSVIQKERLGTAHAVLAARDHLKGLGGTLLVLYGDTPLIPGSVLQSMITLARSEETPGVVVLGFRPENPGAYGRLVLDDAGDVARIVEAKDATPEELEITLCNSGVMAVDALEALSWLEQIDNDNAKGEYYLTDLVAIARRHGRGVKVVEGEVEDLIGVNSPIELAEAEAILQNRLRKAAMAKGVTMIEPTSVYMAHDTDLSSDVVIEPHVCFGLGVQVDRGARIRAFSYLEDCHVGTNATVGPYARLRPGAMIGEGGHIGNFVEIKKATLEPGAKVSHLSYIGDARIGMNANIGAGTITCNYDGYFKSQTNIGAGAFIGSNTAIVAPVTIGDGAIIGAGSVITRDVEADALALARGTQVTKEGAGKLLRTKKAAEKSKSQKP